MKNYISFIVAFLIILIVFSGITKAVKIPNDELWDGWNEEEPGTNNWAYEFIKLPSAWDFTTGSNDIKIGVVDTGFDTKHEDLKENIVPTFLAGLSHNHGTHVAGIIGAKGNNGIGIAGVMWDTSLLPYGAGILVKPEKIFFPTAIADMWFAIKRGARIINYSSGTDHKHLWSVQLENKAWKLLLLDRIKEDNLFVFATGERNVDDKYSSPSSLSKEYNNVISVTASAWLTEELSYGVNYGEISLAAPGEQIFSTLPDDSYGIDEGTSFAAPFVTGLAGLIWSKAEELGESLTAAEVKDLIIQGGVKGGKFVSGPDNKQIPIINAYESLKLLVGPPVGVGGWPMFMHDARHSGQSEYNGPSTPNLKWVYTLAPQMTTGYIGTPIVGQDGTIYIGSGTMYEGYLYAINSDGSLKWKSEKLAAAPSVSAISSNGTAYVYTGGYDFGRGVYALNPENGQEIWSFPVNDRVDYITIGPDQTIYFTSETGYLYALDSNTGDLKWEYDFGTLIIIRSAPAIGPDGTIYVIKSGGTYINSVLYAFDYSGNLKWFKAYGRGEADSVSISRDGTIYAVAGDNLYAINSQGNIIWGVSSGIEIETKTPAIINEQTIIVAGYKKVWAFNSSDGSLKWTYDEPEDFRPTLYAVDKNGVIYLGFRTNDVGSAKVLVLNPEDGSLKWSYSLLTWLYSPPAISDGRLYMAGMDENYNYNLYSFGE